MQQASCQSGYFMIFAGRLEKMKISYMLTGSMAMFQYAVYRMTADVDIVMELQSRHAQLLIQNLTDSLLI